MPDEPCRPSTDPVKLQNECQAAVAAKDLQPTRDKKGNITATHCNQAVRRIVQAMGYHDFDDLAATADIMYAIVTTSSNWKKVDGYDAVVAALSGQIAVAAMPSSRLGEAHGHIAVVYPARSDRSPSLGRDVPMVANVGRKCGIMHSSEAFPVAIGEAEYFVRKLDA